MNLMTFVRFVVLLVIAGTVLSLAPGVVCVRVFCVVVLRPPAITARRGAGESTRRTPAMPSIDCSIRPVVTRPNCRRFLCGKAGRCSVSRRGETGTETSKPPVDGFAAATERTNFAESAF